ncbi:hypothetical protein K1719_021339 [Acacia pycnantha]|nr:hypothetical protein K1719_021339 [Acacia pycnantha]
MSKQWWLENIKKLRKSAISVQFKISNKHFVKVVKVADFGVARVKAQSGVMTAVNETSRWMAPEDGPGIELIKARTGSLLTGYSRTITIKLIKAQINRNRKPHLDKFTNVANIKLLLRGHH